MSSCLPTWLCSKGEKPLEYFISDFDSKPSFEREPQEITSTPNCLQNNKIDSEGAFHYTGFTTFFFVVPFYQASKELDRI